MTISNVYMKSEMGASGSEATFVEFIRFTGPTGYEDGGTDENALLKTAVGKNVTPIAIIPVRCVGANPKYQPKISFTPAYVDSTATFPVADQDGNTIIYKLNSGSEVTLTLSGAHTTAAHLAASLEAVAGLHAYEHGVNVRLKTVRTGADASIEIVGGTANAVYLFSTTAASGSDNPLMLFVDPTTGLDVGNALTTLDLSGNEFECVLLAE